MNYKKTYNALLANKVIRALENRNIEGFYFGTKEDALKKILEIIPNNSVVSCGGSRTLYEIGLHNALNNGQYNFLDPNSVKEASEKEIIAHKALGSDYYLMSSNAISATGELVNIDGIGNRVASLMFGPKYVIVVAGINKVEQNLDAAILRAKSYATHMTLLLFNQDYSSYEELNDASKHVGKQFVITNGSTIKGRIKVILIDENLGF
nr:lactate utilization protein [Clostridioides sp.]